MPENSSQQTCQCDHTLFVEISVFSVKISYSIFIDTVENISQTIQNFFNKYYNNDLQSDLIPKFFQVALNPCFILPCKFPGKKCFGIGPTDKALLTKTESEF